VAERPVGKERNMPVRNRIYRPSKIEDDREISRWHEAARLSIELTKAYPRPDTFLGRKTQEGFPQELSERQQIIEEYVRDLRDVLKALRQCLA
jgi:hypothetical protein